MSGRSPGSSGSEHEVLKIFLQKFVWHIFPKYMSQRDFLKCVDNIMIKCTRIDHTTWWGAVLIPQASTLITWKLLPLSPTRPGARPHHFPHSPPPLPFLLSPRCDPQEPSRHQLEETKPSDQYPPCSNEHWTITNSSSYTSAPGSLWHPPNVPQTPFPTFCIKSLIEQLPGSRVKGYNTSNTHKLFDYIAIPNELNKTRIGRLANRDRLSHLQATRWRILCHLHSPTVSLNSQCVETGRIYTTMVGYLTILAKSVGFW